MPTNQLLLVFPESIGGDSKDSAYSPLVVVRTVILLMVKLFQFKPPVAHPILVITYFDSH